MEQRVARDSHKVKITEFKSRPRNHRAHGTIHEVLVCSVCMGILYRQIDERRMRDARGIDDRTVWREYVS